MMISIRLSKTLYLSILWVVVCSLMLPKTSLGLSYDELRADYFSKNEGRILGATAPSLPRAYVDTTMPSTSNTCTISVPSGGDFQAAINSAKLGDTICLQAGATFTGRFVLPKKTEGSGWVTIRTSTPDANFVSPGTRVSPDKASSMAKIVSRGSNAPALQTGTAANNYRLIGLEVTKAPAPAIVTEFIILGDWRESRVNQYGVDTYYEDQPYNIVLDRMYIHGDRESDTKKGVRMHCNNCAVIDSYISEIQNSGQDAQAIAGWNSRGPFKIVNNYLEATGENIMFGGADPAIKWNPTVAAGATPTSATLSSIDGLTLGQQVMFTVGGQTGESSWTTIRSISGNSVTFDAISAVPDANSKAYWGVIPSDFEIRNNYFFKPRYWKPTDPSYDGRTRSVKNLFETKSMQRILFDGNVLENSWASSQTGGGILIKSANQSGGCPYCHTEDLTITNNIVLNTNHPLVIQGTESNVPGMLTPYTKRVKVQNNLFYNDSTWDVQISRGLRVYNYAADVEISHNTIFSSYSTLATNSELPEVNIPRFVLTNNILERGSYGISAGSYEGKKYLDQYFTGYTYAKNVIINSSSGTNTVTNDYLLARYPSSTLVTSFSDVGFTDPANSDYKLLANSAYKNAGSDDKDIGVDIDALSTAIAGVKTGTIGNNVPVIPPAAPVISSFSALPAAITVGSSTILSWSVSNASAVSIDNGVGAVSGSSVSVSPARTTTYTLTATGSGGAATKSVEVVVTPVTLSGLPSVTSFLATPSSIARGQSTILSWRVYDVSSLALDNGIGTVTGDSTVVSPSTTTTYTLTATNGVGSVKSLFVVTVVEDNTKPPVVASTLPSQLTATRLKLINMNNTFYILSDGVRRGVTSPGILFSYGLEFNDSKTITEEEKLLPEGGLILPEDGALVKSVEDPTVYLISNGRRYGFVSASIFTGLGFSFKNVLVVTNPELQALPKGDNLDNTQAAHLPGVTIDRDGVIYWIDEGSMLHPYPSLAVYNSWRRDGDFLDVVKANPADTALPVGGMIPMRVIE